MRADEGENCEHRERRRMIIRPHALIPARHVLQNAPMKADRRGQEGKVIALSQGETGEYLGTYIADALGC